MAKATTTKVNKAKPKPKIGLNPISSIISFEQFKKNPVAAIAFLAIVGISYLYYDGKSQSDANIQDCRREMKELRDMVFEAKEQARKADSSAAAAMSKATILEKLKSIPE